ncbi:MAG: type II CAAX prenyl endopeptidase Rce1 family protein [Bacillota bacterium]
MSRFWSAFWTVAGFLFLMGLLQMIADTVVILFGVVPLFLGGQSEWLIAISRVAVPIWGALIWGDWKWGWKSDNAGLRTTPAALFWLVPGLLGGLLAGGLALLISQGGSLSLPALKLGPEVLAATLVAMAAAFATELIFRGMVISRLQYDLAGQQLLLLALGMPLAWEFIQAVIGRVLFIYPVPDPDIFGAGTVALSLFLTLLFLRTDSVWLTAGVRMGLALLSGLLGVGGGLSDLRLPIPHLTGLGETGLLVVFGIPAAVLLALELSRLNRLRRPPGPRRGPQRVVHGKTVRGPWGPH